MGKLNPYFKRSPTQDIGTLLCKDELKQLKVGLLSRTNYRTATLSEMKPSNARIPLLVFQPYKNHEYKISIMKIHNNIIQMYIKKIPHQRIMKVLVHPSKQIIMCPIHTSIKYYIISSPMTQVRIPCPIMLLQKNIMCIKIIIHVFFHPISG